MEWFPGQNRVDFQRDNDPVESIFYALDDSNVPDLRLLEVLGFAADCSTGSRREVSVSAAFDNVFVSP